MSRYEAIGTDRSNGKLGLRYHCAADPRIVVRQPFSIGWTDADAIDDDQLEELPQTAERELASLVTTAGEVEFTTSAHIVSARKQVNR